MGRNDGGIFRGASEDTRHTGITHDAETWSGHSVGQEGIKNTQRRNDATTNHRRTQFVRESRLWS